MVVMQMDWKRLQKPERVKLYPAWRLRTNMAFLVSNLQYYLHVDVLEVLYLAHGSNIAETNCSGPISKVKAEDNRVRGL